MKVAITAKEPDAKAPIERRFGRCAYFIVFDSVSRTWQAEANPAAEASGGAGARAVQFLSDLGVEAVVSVDFGPKALRALQAAGIKPYTADNGRADGLLEKFLAGTLREVTESEGSGRGGKRR
jgi:predicted Fe-Mo cluster-binding NifX family protein